MISNSQADEIISIVNNINNMYDDLRDCWNTFQYVAKNGLQYTINKTQSTSLKAKKDELDQTNKILEENINGLEKVMSIVYDYAEEIKKINNGAYDE